MESLLLPAVTWSASLALIVALYKLNRYEQVRGERVVLRRVRQGIDWLLDRAAQVVAQLQARLWQRWSRVRPPRTDSQLTNALMRHATKTPLTVTHTDNHLSQMRDHKSATALTPAQGKKLRHKKLEERF